MQTPRESTERIPLDRQRHLINNFKLATEMGAEVVQVSSPNIAQSIIEEAEKRDITTICIGKPHINLFRVILATNLFNQLLKKLAESDIDLVILS